MIEASRETKNGPFLNIFFSSFQPLENVFVHKEYAIIVFIFFPLAGYTNVNWFHETLDVLEWLQVGGRGYGTL